MGGQLDPKLNRFSRQPASTVKKDASDFEKSSKCLVGSRRFADSCVRVCSSLVGCVGECSKYLKLLMRGMSWSSLAWPVACAFTQVSRGELNQNRNLMWTQNGKVGQILSFSTETNCECMASPCSHSPLSLFSASSLSLDPTSYAHVRINDIHDFLCLSDFQIFLVRERGIFAIIIFGILECFDFWMFGFFGYLFFFCFSISCFIRKYSQLHLNVSHTTTTTNTTITLHHNSNNHAMGWRFVGHIMDVIAPPWVPARTPTVHGGPYAGRPGVARRQVTARDDTCAQQDTDKSQEVPTHT